MKAVIISSGEGNRLRPLTCSAPLCMLPVMGRPIIEHTFRLLKRHNINSVTLSSYYLSDEVKNHFSDFKEERVSFTHKQSFENFFADDDTVLISDSILTDINFEDVISFFNHVKSNVFVTKSAASSYEYGSLHTNGSLITNYTRCPDFAHPTGAAFTGIAVIKKGTRVLDCSDLTTLIQKLVEEKEPLYAYNTQCYVCNVSDFESYHKVCRDFMDKKIMLPFPCDEKAPSVWVDKDATVMQGSVIVPPVYIGSGSLISKGARIEAYTQIGENVSVDCFAGIKRSIIMDNCHIGEGASLRGCILSKKCEIGVESAAYEGSVMGFGSVLGKHCTLRTGVHIWPDKYVEDESCVSENIIWENTCMRSLFSEGSATGAVNREITPEFASSLARSTVTVLGKKIALSCDGGAMGSMIKNALIAGVQSAGGKAYDLGEQPLPITRSAISFYGLDGGIALSFQSVDSVAEGTLDIINKLGANVENTDLLKIQHFTSSGSAKRIGACKICEPEFLFEYKLYYLKQLINSTSQNPLNAKVLIHCPSIWAQDLLKSAANDLNCNFSFTQNHNAEDFAEEVKEGDYDFGAICDYRCEKLTLVTSFGEVLSEFDYSALCALIIMKSFTGALIYIPDSAPESIEMLAQKYGAKVTRTQVSPPHLMNELSKSKRKLFLHQFIYRFDAVGAIILLCDFLHTYNTTVTALKNELPVSYVLSTDVCCSSKEQSEAIRRLCENYDAVPDEYGESIKVSFDNGWVLIVPKKMQSVINVISHGYTKEYAREIADIFVDEIADRK